MSRRLWLVRHGETEGQSSIRYHGANDVPLSEVGRQQIRALLPLLADVRFARIVHSPRSRAAESAAILARGLGYPEQGLECDDRLREISFGACEGMTREQIDAAFPNFFHDYDRGLCDAFPDGEPRAAFAARVAGAITAIVEHDWSGDLLVVAHRGTVRHAIERLLAIEAGSRAAFAVELGSLTVLRERPSGWQLELLGLRL